MAQPVTYALSMYGNPYTNALSIMEKQKVMRLASNEMGKTLASKRDYTKTNAQDKRGQRPKGPSKKYQGKNVSGKTRSENNM